MMKIISTYDNLVSILVDVLLFMVFSVFVGYCVASGFVFLGYLGGNMFQYE